MPSNRQVKQVQSRSPSQSQVLPVGSTSAVLEEFTHEDHWHKQVAAVPRRRPKVSSVARREAVPNVPTTEYDKVMLFLLRLRECLLAASAKGADRPAIQRKISQLQQRIQPVLARIPDGRETAVTLKRVHLILADFERQNSELLALGWVAIDERHFNLESDHSALNKALVRSRRTGKELSVLSAELADVAGKASALQLESLSSAVASLGDLLGNRREHLGEIKECISRAQMRLYDQAIYSKSALAQAVYQPESYHEARAICSRAVAALRPMRSPICEKGLFSIQQLTV